MFHRCILNELLVSSEAHSKTPCNLLTCTLVFRWKVVGKGGLGMILSA